MELGDSSGDALLHSIREQRNKLLVWPFVLALSAATLGSLVAAGVSQAAILTSITVVLAAVTGLVAWRDKLRRLTVLFYEPDAQTERLYAEVVASLREPAGAHKLQSVANTSRYANTRYSAGAQHALEFEDASITLGQAPGIVANITVPLVQAGRTLFAFYPDRVLLLQGPELGSIKYSDLIAQSSTSRYVETQNLPGDATVVDKTWTYVNNNGSPDRRFKGNRQIPVCAYSRLSLTTADGLDIRLMTSKSSAFDAFARGLQALRWAK